MKNYEPRNHQILPKANLSKKSSFFSKRSSSINFEFVKSFNSFSTYSILTNSEATFNSNLSSVYQLLLAGNVIFSAFIYNRGLIFFGADSSHLCLSIVYVILSVSLSVMLRFVHSVIEIKNSTYSPPN